jgi:hypothetical protein
VDGGAVHVRLVPSPRWAEAVTANAGLDAGAQASSAKFIASVEEFVFLTEIYRLDETDASRELGCSERTMLRYKRYLREHPEVKLTVLRVYNDEGEEIA